MALYDPKEFPTETKVSEDFTLADVLAWARTKPADEEYDYGDPGNCALCQFLSGTGRASVPRVRKDSWRDGMQSNDYRRLPVWADDAAVRSPRTFGAFAGRLEKALGK